MSFHQLHPHNSPPPDEWVEILSQEGIPVFFNTVTGECLFESPSGLSRHRKGGSSRSVRRQKPPPPPNKPRELRASASERNLFAPNKSTVNNSLSLVAEDESDSDGLDFDQFRKSQPIELIHRTPTETTLESTSSSNLNNCSPPRSLHRRTHSASNLSPEDDGNDKRKSVHRRKAARKLPFTPEQTELIENLRQQMTSISKQLQQLAPRAEESESSPEEHMVIRVTALPPRSPNRKQKFVSLSPVTPRREEKTPTDTPPLTFLSLCHELNETRKSGHPLPLSPNKLSSPHLTPPRPPHSPQMPATTDTNKWLFKKVKLIGRGVSSKVFEAIQLPDRFHFALKQIHLHQESDAKEIEHAKTVLHREIEIMSKLNHPNILHYFGSHEQPNYKSLHAMIQEQGPLEEWLARVYTQHILQGLVYLHANDVIHRDIKAANILLGNDSFVKLADFGSSKLVEHLLNADGQTHSAVGSPFWMAPEVVQSGVYDAKCDVWGVGCVLIEMITGEHPYAEETPCSAIFKIGKGELPEFSRDNLSLKGFNFILRCLQADPKQRPTAEQLLKDPWLAVDGPSAHDPLARCSPVSPLVSASNSMRSIFSLSDDESQNRCKSSLSDTTNRQPRSTAWVRYIDEEGTPYYYNNATGRSSWSMPAGFEPPRRQQRTQQQPTIDEDNLYAEYDEDEDEEEEEEEQEMFQLEEGAGDDTGLLDPAPFWSVHFAANGTSFFRNNRTNRATFVPPPCFANNPVVAPIEYVPIVPSIGNRRTQSALPLSVHNLNFSHDSSNSRRRGKQQQQQQAIEKHSVSDDDRFDEFDDEEDEMVEHVVETKRAALQRALSSRQLPSSHYRSNQRQPSPIPEQSVSSHSRSSSSSSRKDRGAFFKRLALLRKHEEALKSSLDQLKQKESSNKAINRPMELLSEHEEELQSMTIRSKQLQIKQLQQQLSEMKSSSQPPRTRIRHLSEPVIDLESPAMDEPDLSSLNPLRPKIAALPPPARTSPVKQPPQEHKSNKTTKKKKQSPTSKLTAAPSEQSKRTPTHKHSATHTAGDAVLMKQTDQIDFNSPQKQTSATATSAAREIPLNRPSPLKDLSRFAPSVNTVSTIGSLHVRGRVSTEELPAPPNSYQSPTDIPTPAHSQVGTAHGWRFQKGQLLGKGGFAKVYHAIRLNDATPFAVKQIELQCSDARRLAKQKEELHKEIKIMTRLNHRNCLKYFGSHAQKNYVWIYLELAQKSLAALIKEYKRLDEQVVRNYVKQILEGLAYLHSMDVIHRDIKGANILIGTDGFLKLADFGASKIVENLLSADGQEHSAVGTPFWMAPEIVKYKAYDCKCDIWSVGCVILEMVTGTHPYADTNSFSALYRISQGIKPEIPTHISDGAKKFIERCLQLEPADRPTAAELLSDHWIQIADTQPNISFTIPITPPSAAARSRRESLRSDFTYTGKLESPDKEATEKKHFDFETNDDTVKKQEPTHSPHTSNDSELEEWLTMYESEITQVEPKNESSDDSELDAWNSLYENEISLVDEDAEDDQTRTLPR